MSQSSKPLAGQVALVAGATRGAGRGIARMLGEAGATIYCTGRGSRELPSSVGVYAGRPETIEQTAELVDAAGGRGIAVRVDHAVEKEVATLCKRIHRDNGRLDVLVNVLGGPQVSDWRPFAKLPLEPGRAMLDGWVWPHVITCRYAAPLMIERGAGLIVEIIEGHTLEGRSQIFFDLAVTTLKRLAYNLAEELAPQGVTALAVAPGFMRTEVVLSILGATEANWREVAQNSKQARQFGLAGSETPCFVGRAVAALAADVDVARFSGGVYSSWGLSEVYGFSDIDGARPHWERYGAEHFPDMFRGAARTGKVWQIDDSARKTS